MKIKNLIPIKYKDNYNLKHKNKIKKKYTIIANCQGLVLQQFLKTNTFFVSEYEFIHINLIQNISKEEIDNFYKIIDKLDLLIIQPIDDNYKNYYKCSTKSILKNIRKDCKVIMFPSIYFTGYYPNIVHNYIKEINIIVHDINIIKNFINSKDKESFIKDCIDIINDTNFYSKEFINNNINTSLKELENRETNANINYKPNNFIKLSNFIRENYKKKILFLSLNHQNKYIYRYMSDKILELLLFEKIDYPEELDPQLNLESCIVYKSVINTINKDLTKNIFSQRELPSVNLKTFLEFHYDKYSRVKNYLIETYSEN